MKFGNADSWSSKTQTFKALALSSIILGLSILQSPVSEAKSGQNPYKKQAVELSSEFKPQALGRYQDLPDLPQYTGKFEFVTGFTCPNAKGGVQTTYNLSIRENPQTVVQWYQEALKVYKWELTGASGMTISARKGATYVNMMLTPASGANMNSDLIICYRTTASK